MLKNLKRVMEEGSVSTRQLSLILGISEKSVYNKITGASELTLSEARKIMDVFPQYSMDYLFADEERR